MRYLGTNYRCSVDVFLVLSINLKYLESGSSQVYVMVSQIWRRGCKERVIC